MASFNTNIEVKDPVGQINTWYSSKGIKEIDREIVSEIENVGSFNVYADALYSGDAYVINGLLYSGIQINPEDEIILLATQKINFGNEMQNILFVLMATYFTDISVVGFTDRIYDNYECMETFDATVGAPIKENAEKLRDWLSSMLSLAYTEDFFIYAHFVTDKHHMKNLFDALFPKMRMRIHEGNIIFDAYGIRAYGMSIHD